MTLDEFASAMEARYPDAKNQPKINDIMSIFADQPDSCIKAAFDAYRTEWSGMGCPSSGWFSNQLRTLGYATKEPVRDKSSVFTGAWKCADCGAIYSLCSFACPRCGSRKTTCVVDGSDIAVIDVKEDCWGCKTRDKTIGVYGPDCEKHGRGEMSFEYCDGCACRQCCLFANRFRRNPEGFKNAMAEGKVKMPWMDG